MTILGPTGKPLRSFGTFGTRRRVHVSKLEAGMMLCEHLRGFRDRVLVCEGEVLTVKHVDQIKSWIDRPGAGSLLLYTREIEVKTALGSVDEKPKCETDPYAAHSIQKLYKKGDKVTYGRPKPCGMTRYRVGKGGKLIKVKA